MKARYRIDKPRSGRSTPQRRRHCQPRLERLEDRCVPASGIFVEDFSDDLNPSQPGFDSDAGDGFRIKVDAPSGSEIVDNGFGFINETFSSPHTLQASGLTVVTFPDLAPGDVIHAASIKVWALSSGARFFSTTGESLGVFEIFEFQAVHHLLVTSASRSDSGNPLGPISRIEIGGAIDDIRVQVGDEPPVGGGVIFTENFSDDLEPDRPGFDTGLDGLHIRSTWEGLGGVGGEEGDTEREGGVRFINLPALDIPQPDANQASSPWGLLLEPGDGHDGNLADGSFTARIPGVLERKRDGLLAGEEVALAKVSVYGTGSVTFTGTTGRTSTVDVFPSQGWHFVSRASGFEDENGLKLGGIVEILVRTSDFLVIDDVTVLIGTEQGTGEGRAFDDGYTVQPGDAIVMDVLLNDVAPTQIKLVSAFTMPSHGTVVRSLSGTELVYVSDPGYHGIDTFDYTMEWIGGGHAGSDTGRVVVTVNNVPEAEDFTIFLNHDEVVSRATITGNLLSMGSDRDGDPLMAVLVNDLLYGTVDLQPDGDIAFHSDYAYNAAEDFVGDHFQFKFNDGLNDSRVITVRVGARNREPVASPEFYFMDIFGTSLSIDGPGALENDSDPDGDLLTIEVVIPPTKGRLTRSPSGINGGFIYEPFVGATGWDVFAYQVADFWTRSELVGVTIALPPGPFVPDGGEHTRLARRDGYSVPASVLYRERTRLVVGNDLGIVYDAREEDELNRLKPQSLVDRADLLLEIVRFPQYGAPTLENSGAFTYRGAPGFKGFDELVYQVTYPSRIAGQVVTLVTNPTQVILHIDDTDDVSDEVEDWAPNSGDGNRDGILDSLQANVASLPNTIDGNYVTFAGPTDTFFKPVELSTPVNPPTGVSLPLGLITFQLWGLEPGGAAAVTIDLEHPTQLNSYYKNKRGTTDWYEFLYDGTTGAQFFDAAGQLLAPHSNAVVSRIVLHFVDNQRGDHDGRADGIIFDPGGPAFVRPPTVQSVVVNDGSPQRSLINRLTVTFSDLVTLDPNAFVLRQVGAERIDFDLTTSVVDGRTVVELLLDEPLPDGDYRLKVRGARVHSFGGLALDGNAAGRPGGNYTSRFFQLLGDADGDRDVDELDWRLFRDAYKSLLGEARYRWYFDFDGDGRIEQEDRRWLKRS